MKKNAALVGALALSFAIAAPSANAMFFGGAFKALTDKAGEMAKGAVKAGVDKAKGAIKAGVDKAKAAAAEKAKAFLNQARDLMKAKFEALKDSAKTQVTGFKNDLIKYGKAAVQKELSFLKNKALPQLGKGLRATLQRALQKGWAAGKARAWAAWKKGPKGKGVSGMFQHMKFSFGEGIKGGLSAAKAAALKGAKANFGKFISQIKKRGRASILRLRGQLAKAAKARAGKVVKAVKDAKPAKGQQSAAPAKTK